MASARRVDFLGTPLDLLTMEETLQSVESAMRSRRRLQHVVVNVAKFVSMRNDPELRRDVLDSDIVNVDGSGIALGCRLMGLGRVERVTGVDLMQNVLALCAEKGFRPYILGAKPDILAKAAQVIEARHPGIEFAGLRNGYFKPSEEDEVVKAIRDSKADCLFIAMPSPAKERFMHKYRDRLDVPFLMGVGGSVDVIAGYVKRAPVWVQKIGMEWFYRLAQEPRRLFKRYFTTNLAYAGILLSAMLRRRPGLQPAE
jgi:N-acetylglucosaminyldiphosphoundecaprenol N-acetyl-beta-D-mannosaminyltransferase